MILYPKLERTAEIETSAAELARLSISDCRTRRQTTHRRAVFLATGGTRASANHLEEIANGLTEIAERNGYPRESKRNTKADAEWAEFLHRQLNLTTHQASHDGMWHFFTIALVPDLVRWRWADARNEGPASDRWVTVSHRGRNTFGRLWWRCAILADPEAADPYHLVRELGEDELVQIMERPSFAGNRTLSQASAEVLLEFGAANPSANRAELLREYQKRMLRLGAFLELQLLDKSTLRQLSAELFEKSLKALNK